MTPELLNKLKHLANIAAHLPHDVTLEDEDAAMKALHGELAADTVLQMIALAERALLAAAPAPIQQESTLIAYVATDLDGRYDVGTTPEKAKERAGHGCDTVFPIYDIGDNATPPALAGSQVQAAGDARYKWLANRVLACDYGDNDTKQIGWRLRQESGPIMFGESIDVAIDAAMREQP